MTAVKPVGGPESARPRRGDSDSGSGNAASVNIHIDKIVVDPALVPRSQAAAYRRHLTARLRAMAADPAIATASAHELEARIAHHAREALKAVKSDG